MLKYIVVAGSTVCSIGAILGHLILVSAVEISELLYSLLLAKLAISEKSLLICYFCMLAIVQLNQSL